MGRSVVMCLLSSATLALAACSPFGNGAGNVFQCSDSSQCISGTGGVCEAAGGGACAYTDSSCPSGLSYGTGTSQPPGTCVGDETTPLDAGSGLGMLPDAAITAQSDAPLGSGVAPRTCWGTTLVICPMPVPEANDQPQLGPYATLDTDTDSRCATRPQTGSDTVFGGSGSAGPDLCVISASDWTIYDLTVTGKRPLVIFATDKITLPYGIGLQKFSISTTADQDEAACSTPAGAAPVGVGGAGGSFYTGGGSGGIGDSNGGDSGDPATPSGPLAINSIRGGCRGQDGSGAVGGHSGGAVYLLAGNEIDIDDNIFAGGQGGSGGGSDKSTGGGGGGGGTGGFIGIEAGKLLKIGGVGPKIWARGGGGGGGGGTTPQQKQGLGQGSGAPKVATPGGNGDPGSADSGGGSGGDAGGGNGGTAAAGGAIGKVGANGMNHTGGGGGGGGAGDGVIWLTTPQGSLGGNASPTALLK